MKKTLISAALAAVMLSPYAAYAEPLQYEFDDMAAETAANADAPVYADAAEDAPAEAPAEDAQPQEEGAAEQEWMPEENVQVSDAVGVDISIAPHQLVIDSVAKFNLFDKDGNLVAVDEQWIGGDTESIRLQFSVPPYAVGSEFTLGMVDGFQTLQYYDNVITPGGAFTLGTYAYTDDYGNIVHGNNFSMSAEPYYLQAVNFYYDGKKVSLWPPGQVMDGVCMVSAHDIGKALGLQVKYDSRYDSLVMSVGDKQAIFNMGTSYATFFGNDLYVSHAPVWNGDAVMVPIRDVLNAFGCSIDLWQSDDHIDVIAGKSSVVTEYRNRERVNREGISSRTNYLVWVSKSNYQVKVYQGSRYNWECIRTAPCAIGAPGTPTIEGQFEFQYRGGTWTYPNFYVSPTLVFYGGYALHSTLKAYGGGMYDDRVGVQVSHGCVRLHPDDINWINATIPIGTRIYVTP